MRDSLGKGDGKSNWARERGWLQGEGSWAGAVGQEISYTRARNLLLQQLGRSMD